MPDPILRLDHVGVRFDALKAVDDVSLRVDRGERRAIIGPNGAGKTTLFNAITGVVPPTSGRVEFGGRDITRLPPHRRAAFGISRTFQITNLFPSLTVRENMELALRGLKPRKFSMLGSNELGDDERTQAERALGLTRLNSRTHALVNELSYGEQRQLEMAMALAPDPTLLLLDEPAAGLSPAERVIVADIIRALPASITIILIEHDMDLVLSLVGWVTCLNNGQFLAEGAPADIRSNADVQNVYLGKHTGMLEIRDLHSFYGDAHVVQGATLTVRDREVVALLGRNGMGKTSLIRSVMGLAAPQVRHGSVSWNGETMTGLKPHEIASRRIALVPQGRRLFASLTVTEHLTMIKSARAKDGWTVDRVFGLFPRLAERRHNRGNQLSGGERQMLAVARALMIDPKLLLMDEPSEGLAPVMVQHLEGIITQLKAEGLAILLVEQNLYSALAVADRVYVLETGKVVHESPAATLVDDPQSLVRFLGVH